MSVSPGIERRCYVEAESYGDGTYYGWEEMHHVPFLLGLDEGICLHIRCVSADLSSCSPPAAGQRRLGTTKEECVRRRESMWSRG